MYNLLRHYVQPTTSRPACSCKRPASPCKKTRQNTHENLIAVPATDERKSTVRVKYVCHPDLRCGATTAAPQRRTRAAADSVRFLRQRRGRAAIRPDRHVAGRG